MDLKEIRGDVVRRHPWESSRLSFFKNVLGNYGSKQVSTILDIGSGDAFFAQEIHKAFFPKAKLICFDLNYTEEKRYGLIQFTKTRPSERFDLFLMMDVLEHAERDEEFLEEIVKKNSKGTSLFLISVPAWQKLYTLHDKKLGHFRRYSFNQFEKLLNEKFQNMINVNFNLYKKYSDDPSFKKFMSDRLFEMVWEETGVSQGYQNENYKDRN